MMNDVTGAEICGIRISHDGRTVWICVDGECACRVTRIKKLVVDDDRFALTTEWDGRDLRKLGRRRE